MVTGVFNNGGIYRGDDISCVSADPAPTILMPNARYEKIVEAFGGTGYNVNNPTDLGAALAKALEQRVPALINCSIDPIAGTESGHLSNLNPASAIPVAAAPSS